MRRCSRSPSSPWSQAGSHTSPPVELQAATAQPDLSKPLPPLISSRYRFPEPVCIPATSNTLQKPPRAEPSLHRRPVNQRDTARRALRGLQPLHGKRQNLVGGKGLSSRAGPGAPAPAPDTSKARQRCPPYACSAVRVENREAITAHQVLNLVIEITAAIKRGWAEYITAIRRHLGGGQDSLWESFGCRQRHRDAFGAKFLRRVPLMIRTRSLRPIHSNRWRMLPLLGDLRSYLTPQELDSA